MSSIPPRAVAAADQAAASADEALSAVIQAYRRLA